MIEHSGARITEASGVLEDARGKPGRRQVTVLSRAGWDAACGELGIAPLHWTNRRANLFVEGIDLWGKVGYDLEIGDVRLSITGETRPCHRMDAAHPGLLHALKPAWRGGVTCRVTRSGRVSVGAPVQLRRRIPHQLICVARERARRYLKDGRAVLSKVSSAVRKMTLLIRPERMP